MIAAAIEVAGDIFGWDSIARTWLALAVCFGLRYLSLRFKWNLPRAPRKGDD